MHRGSGVLRGAWQKRHGLERVIEQHAATFRTRALAATESVARNGSYPTTSAQAHYELHPLQNVGRAGSFSAPQSLSSFSSASWASQPCMAPAADAPGSTAGESQAGNGAEASTSGKAEASEARAKAGPAEGRDVDASKEELVQMLAEREVALDEQGEQMKELQEKVLRTLAEMENLRERTAREADNTRKFALQGFARSLLDVADNLSRATGAVPEQFRKTNGSGGSEAEKALRSLLVGVNMTENQLQQVFKRHGLERSDPLGAPFDPNLHNAVFEVEDPSKPAGTVAHVMKAGYSLNDRVIRPADVGVVKGKEE